MTRLVHPLACFGAFYLAAWALLPGCKRQEPVRRTASVAAVSQPRMDLSRFRPVAVGEPANAAEPPWIAHVKAVDLDRDGLCDILVCDAKAHTVTWIRQISKGVFKEQILAADMKAPVHVEAVDMDADGDLDLLVASMGYVFPNNDRIGTVYILENDGRQHFTPHAVLTDTHRVVDVQAGDFNGDGNMDLALAQFGFDQGQVSWLERTGPWEFKQHTLLQLSGAINVCVADFNGDRRLDIATNISQQWEEVYLFQNTGSGFSKMRLWGSTNEDYGSSGMVVCDLNRDGKPDLLFTNGDGLGPAATPGPRPWHGVQWLENSGSGFRYRRIGDLAGAYSPAAVDLDGDGAMDVVAVAAYSDWGNSNPDLVSLIWFKNDGRMNFEPRVLARSPKDLITLSVADFGDGIPALVTGGFYIYPPFDRLSRVTLWRQMESQP